MELPFSGKVPKGPTRNALADEIAAFSNARGGKLVLGIEDDTNGILGIPFENLDSVASLVTEICRDTIDPPSMRWLKNLSYPTVPALCGGFWWWSSIEACQSTVVREDTVSVRIRRSEECQTTSWAG